MTDRVVAVPGTLCAPAVFDRLAAELAGGDGPPVELTGVSWLTEPGPWDIPAISDRLAARLAAEPGGPVLLLGHSTGGAIALRLALDHPELIRALLLVDTGAHMHGHGDVDRIIDTIDTGWGPELHAAVLDRSFATPPGPELRDRLLDYAALVPREAALQVLRSQRDLDLTPRLAGLRCPVAVVHGTLDRTRTPAQARELADALPGATLRLLPAGHTPVHETPAEVAAEIRTLLARAQDR